jgi:hypothetical protein
MRSRTYVGSPRTTAGRPGAGAETMPNLVASTTSSRRPAIALPTASSLGP